MGNHERREYFWVLIALLCDFSFLMAFTEEKEM
jgi:hypothetical protein